MADKTGGSNFVEIGEIVDKSINHSGHAHHCAHFCVKPRRPPPGCGVPRGGGGDEPSGPDVGSPLRDLVTYAKKTAYE